MKNSTSFLSQLLKFFPQKDEAIKSLYEQEFGDLCVDWSNIYNSSEFQLET